MTKPTLTSSDSLPPVPRATCGELAESMDALWQLSGLHWLISAWNRRNRETKRLAEEAQEGAGCVGRVR